LIDEVIKESARERGGYGRQHDVPRKPLIGIFPERGPSYAFKKTSYQAPQFAVEIEYQGRNCAHVQRNIERQPIYGIKSDPVPKQNEMS
jgi:hypothetical protein